MKEQAIRRTPRVRILLLVLCALFALFASGCGDEEAENAMTPDADKDPLKTISNVLLNADIENQLFGTVSNIHKAGSDYTADLRLYEWTEEKEGEAELTDKATFQTITLTKDTTVVYATNSNPHGTVMSAEQFQSEFVDGDAGIFAVYVNEDGTVAIIYSYSLIEQEE